MASHYVNNAEFLAALKEHRAAVLKAKEDNEEKPRVSNFLGGCLLKIATHLSYSSNFINYTYRDEMISDGVENCLTYIDNFDAEKSSNPFAYFTQITYYAFIRRIQKEKKQTYIKGKIIMEMPISSFDVQGQDEDTAYQNAYLNFVQMHGIFSDIVEKEDKRKESKKAKKTATLEDIIEPEQGSQA